MWASFALPFAAVLTGAGGVGGASGGREVIGNSLYTSARYARRWGGDDVAQAEPGTPARGYLADGRFVYLKVSAHDSSRQRTSLSLTKVSHHLCITSRISRVTIDYLGRMIRDLSFVI